MHFRSMDRPAYVVREMASAGPERLGVRLEAPVRS